MKWQSQLTVLLCALFSSQAFSQDEASATELYSSAEEVFENFLFESVNSLLKNNLPSLSIQRTEETGDDSEDGYIAKYELEKKWSKHHSPTLSELREGDATELKNSAIGFEVFANGSYGLDNATNPEELSKIGFAFQFSRSQTPWRDLTKQSASYQTCVVKLEPGDPDANEKAELCWAEYLRIAPDLDEDSYVVKASLDFYTEGNQDFSEKQDVYGANLSLSYDPGIQSTLNNYNIFDYPFYLTRKLTNSPDYSPSFPALSISLEQIDPINNETRSSINGAQDTYDRVNATIAFKTQLASYDQLPINFEWIYRHFYEPNAPDTINQQGLDKFIYRKASIYIPSAIFGVDIEGDEFYLQYSSGELPFDIESTEAISIGWKTNLANLADSFSKVLD